MEKTEKIAVVGTRFGLKPESWEGGTITLERWGAPRWGAEKNQYDERRCYA